jgi:hypothetical protein
MKKICTLILLCSFIVTQAQEKESKEQFPNSKSSYITYNIFSPLNFLSPRYRIGYIKSINEKWRIGIDVGYGNKDINFNLNNKDDGNDYNLFEVRSELYHIFNPTRRVNHYISGEVYYINHNEEFTRDYFFAEEELEGFNDIIRYDSADYNRKKYGFNLKYGVMIPFGDKVGMNIYTGLGIRIKNNQYSNIINPTPDQDFDDDWSFLENYYRKEGISTGVNFVLGAKFFYRF